MNRTKIIAGPAYIGSCVLTRDLVAALLKRKKYEPTGVAELLAAHEEATSAAHDVADLTTQRSVQQLLSSERHEAIFQKLMAKSTPRSNNLMLACALPHASDWLLAPPIAGLGLGLSSVEFRTALKFRLGIPLTRSRSLARPSAKRAWNARTKWTSSGITPSVATMAPRTCFVTTARGTSWATQRERLASRQLS